jgi:hypothetical protein
MSEESKVIKLYSEEETAEHIIEDVRGVFKWECPCCCTEFESEEDEDTMNKFIVRLIKTDKIRRVQNNCMIGVFCPECYNDPEFRDSTL